ncbi:MAG: formyltetrahydrofolate deformylase [Planctomycetota bacterium]
MPTVKAVVSVFGQDQKGVVARFATYLAERGVNILDLEQQVASGTFLMDMLVDLGEMSLTLDELIPGLLGEGDAIGMTVKVALQNENRRPRVAVLVTKERHCLDELVDRWKAGDLRGDLCCVLGNHPDLETVAKEAGLPFASYPSTNKEEHFAWIEENLAEFNADCVALARYMQIVPPRLVKAFPHRIINIHPSLLPHFPGASPYKRAWEAGVRVAGCTAHYVTEDLDEGPIILQDVFTIDVGRDSADDVKHNGQALEGKILADALAMHLDEKLVVVGDKVVFRPGLSAMLG